MAEEKPVERVLVLVPLDKAESNAVERVGY